MPGSSALLFPDKEIPVPYTAEISRTNPTAIIFLLDQSSSMLEAFGAQPGGGTPMYEALRKAKEEVDTFLSIQPNCFPPLVINITDGQPTDGDARAVIATAEDLRAMASRDGHVLLFNAHLSEKRSRPIEFPDDEADLPDDFARLLFRMSSELPPKLAEAAKHDGF